MFLIDRDQACRDGSRGRNQHPVLNPASTVWTGRVNAALRAEVLLFSDLVGRQGTHNNARVIRR